VTTLVLEAPAKLNLFLHVVGRRADGFHLLQSCCQFIDRCDRITLAPRADGAVRRMLGAAGVPEAADLAVRAAVALKAAYGVRAGADIAIEKRIPQGGLGGGSSDAAAVLLGLDALWGIDAGREALARIGLGLGADLPLFIHGKAAFVEGVGEQLTPVTLPEPWYLVLAPKALVSTAEMYQAPELTRDSTPIRLRALFAGLRQGNLTNAFEEVARARFPEVDEALRWLSRRADARLTGSGGCVFAAFGSQSDAERTLAQRPAGWQGFVAKGLNRSPLEVWGVAKRQGNGF
jgi:4-diphosphocytidyl-2-C-methyl-D-erythritol kinase